MFLSAKKAAATMGISARTLYKLCNEGKVSVLKTGSQKLLFDCDTLREELKSLMIPATNSVE